MYSCKQVNYSLTSGKCKHYSNITAYLSKTQQKRDKTNAATMVTVFTENNVNIHKISFIIILFRKSCKHVLLNSKHYGNY